MVLLIRFCLHGFACLEIFLFFNLNVYDGVKLIENA